MKHCSKALRLASKALTFYLIFFFTAGNVLAQMNVEDRNQSTTTRNPDFRPTTVRDLSSSATDGISPSSSSMPGGFGGMSSAKGFGAIGALSTQPISVHVLGEVSSPGVFQMFISQRLTDALAASVPVRHTTRVVQIRRPGQESRFYDLYQYYYYGNLRHNPYISDQDIIFIPTHKGMIRFEGAVKRPGAYELYYEKNLHQALSLAGGFSSSISKSQPLKVIRYLADGEKTIIEVERDNKALKNFKIKKGDVVIIPDVINAQKNFDYTIETLPGENHVYPTSTPDVYVMGAVNRSGPYKYKSQLTIKDYLGFAGAAPNAKLRSFKVIRDGKTKRMKLSDSVVAGDIIMVREKNLDTFVKYLGIASTILGVTLSAIVIKDVVKN